MFARASALALTEDQRAEIESLVRSGSTPQKIASKGRLILLAQQGLANHAIAKQLSVSRRTVLAIRSAFALRGIEAITGTSKRKRRAKVLTPELEQNILDATLKTRPADGSTHCSVRPLRSQGAGYCGFVAGLVRPGFGVVHG